MNIEVLLFARLRELVGHDRVVVQRQELLTVRDVWDGLRAQYPQVEGFGKSLLVSVNREFAAWDTAVKEVKLPKYEKWGSYAQYFAGNVERFAAIGAAATERNSTERRKQGCGPGSGRSPLSIARRIAASRR